MRYLVLVAVLVAATLSGCFGDDGLEPRSTNAELIEHARATLGEDAELYSISGIEPNEPIPAAETEGCGTIPAASDPGKGKPPVWAFIYGSESAQEALVIVKDEGGKTLCEMEEQHFMGADPLDSWEVTAPQAARTIADNVDDYEEQVEGADVIMELAQTADGPVWSFMAFSESSFGSWMVHADTREFMEDLLEPVPIDTPQPAPAPIPESGREEGSMAGTAVLMVSSDPADFEIYSDGHESLELVVESEDPLAQLGQSYAVLVTDPSGQEEGFTATNGETISIAPAAGAYAVAVFPVAAATADFTVEYCAYTDEHCEAAPVEVGYAESARWMPWTG